MRIIIACFALFFFTSLKAQIRSDAEYMCSQWGGVFTTPHTTKYLLETEPLNRMGTLFPPTPLWEMGLFYLPIQSSDPRSPWRIVLAKEREDGFLGQSDQEEYRLPYTFAGGNIAYDDVEKGVWLTVKNKKDSYKLLFFRPGEKPQEFPFSDPKASFAWPSITVYGSDMMYFSAKYPDSNTGWDIYSSKRGPAGWEAPVKMGPKVNTNGDECHPHAGSENITHWATLLYFSSNGHVLKALGDSANFDLYAYTPHFDSLLLLPYPINTKADDIAIGGDYRDDVWVTSNRPLRGTDGPGPWTLYHLTAKPSYYGQVIDRFTGEGLKDVRLTPAYKSPYFRERLPLKYFNSVYSNWQGFFEFWPQICEQYDLYFIHPGYDTLFLPGITGASIDQYIDTLHLTPSIYTYLNLQVNAPSQDQATTFDIQLWENGMLQDSLQLDKKGHLYHPLQPATPYRLRISSPDFPPQERTFTTSHKPQELITQTFDFRGLN